MANWENVTFGGSKMPSWKAEKDGIIYNDKKYLYSEMNSSIDIFSMGELFFNGFLLATLDGEVTQLSFSKRDNSLIEEFVADVNSIIPQNNVDNHNNEDIQSEDSHYNELPAGAIYALDGARGKSLTVYEDKVVIKVNLTIGSLLASNATDGAKTIYYSDVIGMQFKESGVTLGYLQLETASGQMNNLGSNFFSENSYTFNLDQDVIMREVYKYITERVEYYKSLKNQQQPVGQQISGADELIKFKQLLDMGVITQEEFDAKKKQILNL